MSIFTRYQQAFFSFLLLLTAAIWGSSFLVLKDTLELLPLIFILAARFTIAGLALAYYLWVARPQWNKALGVGGLVTGSLLFLAYATQGYGLYYTTVSKNALFCALYVIFVPFLAYWVRRERLAPAVYWAAVISFVGVAVISDPRGLNALNKGDLWSIFGAFCDASHIIAVAHFSTKVETMPLSALQFMVAALWGWLGVYAWGAFPPEISGAAWGGLAWISIMATLVAVCIMNLAIRYVSSARTVILLSTESLFACFCGIIFRDDPFSWQFASGVVLILGDVLLSQLGVSTKGPAAPLEDSTSAPACK